MKHAEDVWVDGGPAYPVRHHEHKEVIEAGYDTSVHWTMGQSLRDVFAAAALAGGLEQGVEHDMASDGDSWYHDPHKIARRAWAIADAMLDTKYE